MNHSLRWHLLIGLLFAASLILTVSPVQAASTTTAENWDSYTVGVYPPLPFSARQPGWTYGTSTGSCSGSSVGVENAPSPVSPVSGKVGRVNGVSRSSAGAGTSTACGQLLTTNVAFNCNGEGVVNASPVNQYETDYYLTSLPAANNPANANSGITILNLQGTAETNGFRLGVSSGAPNTVSATVTTSTGQSSSGTLTTAFSANTWWHFTLYGFDCDGFEGFIANAYTNAAPATQYTVTVGYQVDLTGSVGGGITQGVNVIRAGDSAAFTDAGGSSSSSVGTSYYDNEKWTYTAVTTGSGQGALFCPDAYITETSGTGDSPNYGYTYRRGGGFFDQSQTDLTGVGLSTGFLYEGTTATESTWDYSAKGLTTGTHAAHHNITMEAATDTVSSNFRIAFMTNSGATPSVTSKGNGVNTGNFADHAEAQFIEAGNTWQIGIYYVTAGGSKTQIGSSVNYGHSNDATDFTIYLDTRAANPFIAVRGSTGQILSSNGTAANAEAFRTAFSGDPIYDFWLIGAGSSGLATPATAIDENQQHDLDNTDDEGGHDSTCIFDDEGVGVVLGTAGVAPGSSIEQPPSDPEEPDDPAHLDFGSTAANLVAGALFIIVMALLAIEKGAGNVGIGAIVIGALFLAHVLGWIPLGYLLMLMVLCVAALWFLPSFGGGGREEKAGGF